MEHPKAKRRNKKQKLRDEKVAASPPSNPAIFRFSYVLELEFSPVWGYLLSEDILNVLRACPTAFVPDFVDTVAKKAIDLFAVENKTHLGRQCGCDWMRSLGFDIRSGDKCKNTAPFSMDKTLPIFQVPSGSLNLLAALVLTEKLMRPFRSARRFRDAVFAPIVCPLATKEDPIVQSKAAVTRGMNKVAPGSGSRYFYKYKLRNERTYSDFLEQHWNGMDGSLCGYCDSLTGPNVKRSKQFGTWTSPEVIKIHANCKKLYRPLKVAMEKDLQHVRVIRQRNVRSHERVNLTLVGYESLVAGITEGGVLCGLYVVSGYNPAR